MPVSSSQSRVTIQLNLVGQAASVRGIQQTTAALKELQTVAADGNAQLAASSEAAATKIDAANASIADSARTAAAKVTAANDEVKASQTTLAATAETSAARVSTATASASSGLVGLLSSFKALSVGAATYLGVKAFTSYSTSLTQLSTLAGLTQAQVASLNSEIMRTAPALRQSPAALAQAAYSPASERFGLAGTEQVMRYAAQLTNLSGNPIGGGAGSTSYAISTMLQTLGLRPTPANVAKVAAMIRGTTSAGDMQLTDLTGAMSTGILNTGKTYGIDPEATLGALAYFTSQGVPAQESATRLRMTESLLVGQTAQAAKYGSALGLNVSASGESGLSAQLSALGLSPTKMSALLRTGPGGLVAAFNLINSSLASLPPDQREAVWSKLFGGGRTDATAMQLAQGAMNGQLQNFTGSVIGSSTVAGFNQATNEYNNSPQGKLKQFEAELQTFATQFGSVVLPVLQQLMDVLGPLLGLFAQHKALLDALAILIGGELALKLFGLVKNLKLVGGALKLIRDAKAFDSIITGAQTAESAVGRLIQKILGSKSAWAGLPGGGSAGGAAAGAGEGAAAGAAGAAGVGLAGGATVAGGLTAIAGITGYGLYLGVNPSAISAGAAYADSFGMPAAGGLPQSIARLPDLSHLPNLSGLAGVHGYAQGGITDGPMAIVGEGSCIAEGTLIETVHGPVSIEDVQIGEMVRTRTGYKEVLWSGKTRLDAEVLILDCHTRSVTCTPDHRVWALPTSLDTGEHLRAAEWAQDVPDLQAGDGPGLDARVPLLEEGRWVEAKDLRCGDFVWTLADGGDQLQPARIAAIGAADRIDTYDLTVEDDHEFVAGGILVHNSQWPEYVIPTDPNYRKRALALFASLGGHLLGSDPSLMIAMGPGAKGKTPAGGGGHAAGGSNVALGRRMAAAMGWAGSEWAALNALWMQESGWNNLARNPSSGAYGIPQALPASKLPLAGQAAGGSNPAAQIAWGLSYIRQRYGDPAGAEAHEKNFGWYARGGVLPFASYDTGGFLPEGVSIAHNGTGSPEPVGHGLAGGDLTVKIVLDTKTVGQTVIKDFRRRTARL